MNKRFQIIVSNIGMVDETNDSAKALSAFNEYKRQSQTNYGRAAGEDVSLLEFNELRKEYEPKREHFGDYEG